MGETAEKLKYKGHHIRIEYDDSPTDPREWDNACKMVCQHRRYTLGDEQYSNEYAGSWKEWFAEYVMKNHKPFDNKHYDEEGYLDDAGVKKVWKWIEANMVVQAINMYDHSGISLSTSNGYPYNDRWDAGQVGFAYMTKKMIMDNFQVAGKNLTPKLKERARELIDAEVEEYDQYLRGEVYGYMVADPEDPDFGFYRDSCWGYYSTEDAIAEAKSVVDYYIKEARKKRYVKLKQLIRAGVDFIKRQLILDTEYKIYA